ncbi:MAG: hypothetical protein HC936_18505 [Leptolyngbyaceae cyanobacterium SU_3_3]|nr:hypothetical protein [Leptolyngbyaceae cyanobacterium SU_3_3]
MDLHQFGGCVVGAGKTEEAIKNYRVALNLPERSGLIGSAHTATYNSLGLALQRQGKLKEAIEAFSGSDFARRALGDHVYESLLQNKTIEYDQYRRHVTDYEMDRYLAVL